ncbi:cupin domain-containing protein [Kitasatospora sp. NPDC097691]|uniref:cupin domain-containing protein n=1 Tax=Kitasatospora sp. NPDC097691 TaxID=3157231 RepID=UPI003332CABB
MTHHLGESGENKAEFRFATATPDVLVGEGGTTVHYLVDPLCAKNRFGLYRLDLGPRPGGPAPHFHRTMSESFFVLSGTVRLYDGERWADSGAGDFLHVPEGAVHAFSNDSGEPASMLMLFAPGVPRAPFFEELSEIVSDGGRLSAEEWAEFYRRHDHYIA